MSHRRLPSAAGPGCLATIYPVAVCHLLSAVGAGLEDAAWFCFNGDFGKSHWQVPFLDVGLRPRRPISGRVTPAPREGGVTGVPASGSPTVRRRELGTLLRALRTRKGWTAEQVAGRLMFSPSKVSRLETGQRGASARDIRDLCDLYEVDGEERQHLVDLASEGSSEPGGSPWACRIPPTSGWRPKQLPSATTAWASCPACSRPLITRAQWSRPRCRVGT